MNEGNDIRWKQRFQNYEKSFLLLKRTLGIKNPSEAENYEAIRNKALIDHIDRVGEVIYSKNR